MNLNLKIEFITLILKVKKLLYEVKLIFKNQKKIFENFRFSFHSKTRNNDAQIFDPIPSWSNFSQFLNVNEPRKLQI